MREVYCDKCRRSFSQLENEGQHRYIPTCFFGGAHHFTEEKLPELILANHEGTERVQ